MDASAAPFGLAGGPLERSITAVGAVDTNDDPVSAHRCVLCCLQVLLMLAATLVPKVLTDAGLTALPGMARWRSDGRKRCEMRIRATCPLAAKSAAAAPAVEQAEEQ
jgi:hypothetical protein